jgi:two-component system sensor histidine kinase RegB
MDNPANLFDYFRVGMWANFMVSVGLISWFVARMSQALRARDAALAEAQQRLLRDERVVALGAQAASVAHEIGTPLSSIAMLAEELRNAARDDAGLAPYAADLELIEQQTGLCKSVVARLQTRATLATNRQSVITWLASFVEQWRLRHPHVKFDQVGQVPDGVLVDDTVAVGQILTILLDNAARASRDFVTLEVLLDGKTLEFQVCDRGTGIAAPLREQLGNTPVISTQGGQGVGLYLAFATAARLRGAVELLDAPGRGTRAILRLPAMRAEEHDE